MYEGASVLKKSPGPIKAFQKNADKNLYPEHNIRHPFLSATGGKTAAKYGEDYVQINTKIESSKLL